MTRTSSAALSSESDAVSRSMYSPIWPNETVVDAAAALPHVTLPGPLTLLHVVVTALPAGRPSSLTVPAMDALAGRVTAVSAPALTLGARFVGGTGLTEIATSSDAVSAESLAVSRSTYRPACENVALAVRLAPLPNCTVPVPLTFVHCVVTADPAGSPSSVAVPARLAFAGSVIVWSAPAFTVGRWLTTAGATVTATS